MDTPTKYILLFALFLSFMIFLSIRRQEKLLKANFTIAEGYLRACHSSSQYSDPGEVNIRIKGVITTVPIIGGLDSDQFCESISLRDCMRLKRTPVVAVYNSEQMLKAKVLLTRRDFEEFGIPYPENRDPLLEKLFGCE